MSPAVAPKGGSVFDLFCKMSSVFQVNFIQLRHVGEVTLSQVAALAQYPSLAVGSLAL